MIHIRALTLLYINSSILFRIIYAAFVTNSGVIFVTGSGVIEITIEREGRRLAVTDNNRFGGTIQLYSFLLSYDARRRYCIRTYWGLDKISPAFIAVYPKFVAQKGEIVV